MCSEAVASLCGPAVHWCQQQQQQRCEWAARSVHRVLLCWLLTLRTGTRSLSLVHECTVRVNGCECVLQCRAVDSAAVGASRPSQCPSC